MLLKNIQIKGFKSFADKITLHFNEGVTGIVGPNGCGKSNIVDAVRWVLGENKSKLLRSEKMENIIFNGSKSRQQTQMAEVTLTFINTKNILPTEYAEVSITRKYFRSGESEYSLNGVVCRQKDIQNLFLDTGIASNSYAIIELAMVDTLLNNKDNSRRFLFEEAAGISRFKIRKKETLKKLENTDSDLERVDDLLYEIDKNLKSMERQSKQTEKYYKLKDQYKHYSTQLAQHYLLVENENLDTIKREKTTFEDQKRGMQTKFNQLEAQNEVEKTHLLKEEKALSQLQESLNKQVEKIRIHENENQINTVRKNNLTEKAQNIKNSTAIEKKKLENIEIEIRKYHDEIVSAKEKVDEVAENRNAFNTELSVQKEEYLNFQKTLENAAQSLKVQNELCFNLNKEKEINEIKIESLQKNLDKSTESNAQRKEKIASIDEELKHNTNAQNDILALLESHKKAESQNDENIQYYWKQIDLLKEELNKLNRKIDAVQNEYNLTQSLLENLEGYPEAIKYLKKNEQWKKYPILSDIISCKDEYKNTIENFLEPYLNYFVVFSKSDALQAVQMLYQHAKGRASFFILDELENYKINEITLLPGTLAATEIVDYERVYQKLIALLLSNVFIIENENFQYDFKNDVVLLEKSGKIVAGRYTIHGGSQGLFDGNRMGRGKNLNRLAGVLQKYSKSKQELNKNLLFNENEIKKLQSQSKKEEIENLEIQLKSLNEQNISLNINKNQIQEWLKQHFETHENTNEEMGVLQKNIALIEKKWEDENKKRTHFENEFQTLQLESNKKSESLNKITDAFNQINILFHQKENELKGLEEKKSFREETQKQSLATLDTNQKLGEEVSQNLKQLEKKVAENDEILLSLYQDKDDLEKKVYQQELAYYNIRSSLGKNDKSIREVQTAKENLDSEIQKLKDKENAIALKIQSIKDRLSVEFEVNFDNEIEQNEAERVNTTTALEWEKKIESLKEKIQNYGAINPLAMEAYEEIQKRYQFITQQKEDLLASKETILSTISEIDSVAKEEFMNAFRKIEKHFVEIFRTLFSQEDDCQLLLTLPDQPLDSGIEIIAKPKGKKPLSINQLSGGEKTLTAISLLFSIYLLKPAPFCIFDEVDAPLDDTNIDKFNEIIKKFSNQSQFIIVTHNKRTMNNTDIIYGVTMLEQGVSKVIPVNLGTIKE